jgi:hypothetical protein
VNEGRNESLVATRYIASVCVCVSISTYTPTSIKLIIQLKGKPASSPHGQVLCIAQQKIVITACPIVDCELRLEFEDEALAVCVWVCGWVWV